MSNQQQKFKTKVVYFCFEVPQYYTEADLNNCWLTRDDWINKIAYAWTDPKSSLESFKEEFLGYCMERLDSYDEEVSEHIMMRHEELEKKKEVSHV